jgi:hypothetical protein
MDIVIEDYKWIETLFEDSDHERRVCISARS